MDAARRVFEQDLAAEPGLLERLSFVDRPMDALEGADALLLVTEWRNYRSLNLAQVKRAMRSALVFDGRNLYDPHQFAAAGVACIGIGRSNLHLLKEDAAGSKVADATARKKSARIAAGAFG